MAALSDVDRTALWADLMREISRVVEPLGALTKADLRAAVDAADAWADANASSYNLALPQPARGVLTAKQKARLLMFVLRRRFEVA